MAHNLYGARSWKESLMTLQQSRSIDGLAEILQAVNIFTP